MSDKTNTIADKSNTMELIRLSLKNNIRQYTMIIALFLVMLIFTVLEGIFANGVFMSSRNLSNLLLQTATVAVLSCGIVMVIVAGHIDLSVGSVVGFTGAIAAILQSRMGWGTIQVVVVTLLIGAAIGLWQGYWVAYQDVPAFIVTLAGMLIFRGGILYITKGATISSLNKSFNALSGSYVPTFLEDSPINLMAIVVGILGILIYNVMEIRNRKERVSYGFIVAPTSLQLLKVIGVSIAIGAFFMVLASYKGIPYAVVILIIIAIIYTFVTTKTKFGRYVYAIGGNKEAAKLSGVNIRQVNLFIFISMGILTSLGGMLYTARLGSATADAGNGLELEVIASAIIGGTSTLGGEGTIVGAIIGALVMTTLNNGMELMSAPSEWKYIIKGLILLLAVWFDISQRKNKK